MPDARHFRDQKYCSQPACRRAGKHASQRRWLMSDKGAAYRDPEENKRRVRQWRARHPDYAKLTGGRRRNALQETTAVEHVDNQSVTSSLVADALQDMNFTQPALAVGLIASLTGNALQETIAESARRFVLLGQDILGNGPGINPRGGRRDGGNKTTIVSRASAACSTGIQLG